MRTPAPLALALLFSVLALLASGCNDSNKTQYASNEGDANSAEPENNSAEPENNSTEPENNSAEPENNSAEPENNSAGSENNSTAPTGAPDGAACTSDDECAGGTCLTSEEYPGGYCTTEDCANQGGCASPNAQCAYLNADRDESACFAACEDDATCREGYACEAFGEVSLCVAEEVEREPQPDGSPCETREDCQGGTCLTEADGFPNGYCTTINCQNRRDCSGEGAACLVAAQPTICVELCDGPSDCRDGYICQPVQGAAYCAPSPAAGNFIPEEGDLPFELTCAETLVEEDAFQGGLDRHVLPFQLPEGTSSFMVVPYSRGGQIYPVELNGPNGSLDFFDEYSFSLANSSILINMTPILVPQAPQFADFVAPGQYNLNVAAEENLCFYVIPKNKAGTTVDLNLHFVGAGGLDSASAPGNEGFQRALARFNEIYSQAGVSIGQIRYTDVTGANLARYRLIRDQESVFRLVALAEPPGETAEDLLSINVFFIDDFAIQGGSVLGISAGLPGAAGYHGGRGSGLVFSAAVQSDPELLGQVLAHEVGHYLGLFHTSEQQGQGFDPLEDTPTCPSNSWGNPGNCPDITNLMFPFAGDDHTRITEDQSSVFRANPLIQ